MPTVAVNKIVSGVTPTGDFLCYEVESDNPKITPYRVDLQMFCGNGKCDCPSFLIGKDGKHRQLKKGAIPNEILECKHIKKARRYFAFECLNRLIQVREEISNDNKKAAKAKGTLDHRLPGPAREVDETTDRPPLGSAEAEAPSPDEMPWDDESVPF